VATIAATRITLSADLPAPAYAPPVAAPYNWTGSYIGGNIGYGWGSDPIDLTPFAVFPAGAVPISLADNPRGVLGGVPYCPNSQFHRVVLGWGLDFFFSHIQAPQNVFTGPGGLP